MEEIIKDTERENIVVSLYKFIKRNDYSIHENNYVPLAIYLSQEHKCDIGDAYVEYLMQHVIPYVIKKNYDSDKALILELRKYLSYKKKISMKKRSYYVNSISQGMLEVLSNPENNIPEKDYMDIINHYKPFKQLNLDSAYKFLDSSFSHELAVQLLSKKEKKVTFKKSIKEIANLVLQEGNVSREDITQSFTSLVLSDNSIFGRIQGEDILTPITMAVSFHCGHSVNDIFICHMLEQCYKHRIIYIQRNNFFSDISYNIISYRKIKDEEIASLQKLISEDYKGDCIQKTDVQNYQYKVFAFLLALFINHINGAYSIDKFPYILENMNLLNIEMPLSEINDFFFHKLSNLSVAEEITEFVRDMRKLYKLNPKDDIGTENILSIMKRKSELMKKLDIRFSEDILRELQAIDKEYHEVFVNELENCIKNYGCTMILNPWDDCTTDVKFDWGYFNQNHIKGFKFVTTAKRIRFSGANSKDLMKELFELGIMKEEYYGDIRYFYPLFNNIHISGNISYFKDRTDFYELRFALMKRNISITYTNLKDAYAEVECSFDDYKSLMDDSDFYLKESPFLPGACYMEFPDK